MSWIHRADGTEPVMPVFVYGTLRLEEPMVHIWQSDVERIFDSCTVEGYTLWMVTSKLYPVAKEALGSRIWGDLLWPRPGATADHLMNMLDAYENAPRLFERTIVNVDHCRKLDGGITKAWMYQQGPLFREGTLSTPTHLGASWKLRDEQARDRHLRVVS